jgi:hypothetical protein
VHEGKVFFREIGERIKDHKSTCKRWRGRFDSSRQRFFGRLKVRWPSGRTQVYQNLAANQYFLLKEKTR